MGKVATEATLQEGVKLLSIIARNEVLNIQNFKTMQQIVRDGMAPQLFKIGDQIIVKWNDGTKDYDLPFDIVHFDTVIGKDGTSVPGMYLQSHYALPGVQFDGNEAFYHCDAELAAGTYNITMGNDWGKNVVNGDVFSFTLTKNVPVGGQLVLTTATSTTAGLPDQSPANWRVRSYESANATTELEMVTLTKSADGTSLGTLSSATKYSDTGINNMQRAGYGYNRWAQSGIRQWLNSSAAKGNWWTAQNVFDRPPDQLATMNGFLHGLDPEFLDVIQPVKVTTALNTVSDSTIGTTEDTMDRFFLPSLQQEYCQPQLANVEGKAWEYWIERLGTPNPQGYYQENELKEHIRYSITNPSSAVTVRLRSASRLSAHSAWSVHASGLVSSNGATYAGAPAPACVLY